MLFSRLWNGGLAEPRHIRRMRVYLQEARMAMLEHSIAAEYYQSSAAMYAARAQRMEEEIRSWEEQALRRHSAAKGLGPPAAEPPVSVAPPASSVVRVV